MFEDEKVYEKIRDKAFASIKNGDGFYKSIFTDEYNTLDEDEKAYAFGSLMADFGWGIKEFIDACVQEQQATKSTSNIKEISIELMGMVLSNAKEL